MFVSLHDPNRHTAAIASGISGLGTEIRTRWTAGSLADRLREVSALRERLDAEVIRLVGDFDAAGAAAVEGAASTASWLRAHTTTPGGRARDLVRAGRLAHRYDSTAVALSDGKLSADHLIAMSRAIGERRGDLYGDHEAGLLDAAGGLDLESFTKVANRWAKLADDVLSSGDFMRHHRNRYFNISPTLDGAFAIDGFLDADAGATVAAAINHLATPQGADDNRSPAQRRADALTQLANGTRVDGSDPARVSVVVDVETLKGELPEDLRTARADMDWVGPVGRRTIERIVCDPAINRVIMRGRSEILDWGRTNRLVTATQRRALAIRDGGCTAPGCNVPPQWCDAHHIQHWLDGGPTDISNLKLLCRRHHVLHHEGGHTTSHGAAGRRGDGGPEDRSRIRDRQTLRAAPPPPDP